MENLTDRQTAILRLVESQGYVTIEALAETFGVSAQTVRRDIISLDGAGLLQRFHGGAGSAAPGETLRLGHFRKQDLNTEAKRKIAASALDWIGDGMSVFLDVGTTVQALAEAMNVRSNLLIFTTSLRTALMLDHDRHQVHVLGGRLSGKDGSLTGEEVVLALTRLRLDLSVVACSAVSPAGEAMDFDLGKIAVKRAAMAVSSKSLLLVTGDKFGRSARAVIASTNAFDAVVSDGAVP